MGGKPRRSAPQGIADLEAAQPASSVDWSRASRGAIPALSITCYFGGSLHDHAPTYADGLESYIDYVGLDVLKSYVARTGYPTKMSKRRLNRDLRHLRNFPPAHRGIHIYYYSTMRGDPPGPFGVCIRDTERSPELWGDRQAGMMHFTFPFDWLEGKGIDGFMEFAVGLMELPHVQSAAAGYQLRTTAHSGQLFPFDKVHQRFLGLFSARLIPRDMGGSSPPATWLNYLDLELTNALGGLDVLCSALPDCELHTLADGVLIRGATLPPLGDLESGAVDIGCLPSVSRLLAPIRVTSCDQFPNMEGLMARLDSLDDRPWDNS